MTGTIEIDGKAVKLSSPQRAKSADVGMALIPEDRKNEGLMLPMSVRDNLSFAAVESFSRFGVVDRKAEEAAIDEMIKLLQIRSDGIDGPVASLSGGNQQKVVIGKWLMTKPRIILLNDPTRGIDVGTKQELYQLLRRLAESGAAILFYSTDYDELIGCCDRVLVLYNGAVTRTLEGGRADRAQSHRQRPQPAGVGAAARRRRACRGGGAMSAGGEAAVGGRRSWEGWGHWLDRPARPPDFGRDLRRHVRLLRLEAGGRAHRQHRQYRRQQGRAPRACRDGADDPGAHRRPRPVGGHGLRAHQLPGGDHRQRRSPDDGARHRRRARRRARLRRGQRA